MNLRFYDDGLEKELRINLESMAEYVMHLYSLNKECDDQFVEERKKAARATIKDMRALVCSHYIKYPETGFYGEYLQEVQPTMSKLRKQKTEKAKEEFKKLDIIKDSIRCGKRTADQYLKNRVQEDEIFA